MEVIRSVQSYWRRRTYQRLESLPTHTKKGGAVRLGGGGKRWRRPCKAVVVVRPARVMVKVKDAYMNAMLMLAGDGGAAAKKESRGGAVWDRRIPTARQGSSRGGDFEKRILIHLYNSVINTR